MSNLANRETLASRLGFIFVAAGCAVGLGNVWRFPYMVGQHGGGIFVLFYLIFLVILGLPLITMEFSIGRASRTSLLHSYEKLAPKAKVFQKIAPFQCLGNWALMMFYTSVAGWMLFYAVQSILNKIPTQNTDELGTYFGTFLENPTAQVFWMTLVVAIGFIACYAGLQKGVERITKWMMSCLLVILVGMAIRSVMLKGGGAGIEFYLKPDFSVLKSFNSTSSLLIAAIGQAFFTLSIGVGSMSIFGSYTSKESSLVRESITIISLDTFVAIISGLIIFPACMAFCVQPDSGPGLVFITLPRIFDQMPGGVFWAALFFVFLALASITTVIAVFENIISIEMDRHQISRKKAVSIFIPILWVLSLPCALSGFLGLGSKILDWEDFFVSNIALPMGSLVILVFCVSKRAWGWKNFVGEASIGKGLNFPEWSRVYVTYILPLIIIAVFICQLISVLSKQ